jgi:aspartyl-tRNA(Asn)/glutamyl-tRNA(Gln) amidotransferase subunit C
VAVTIDDVRHVAALARLGLGDERAAALVQELNGILAHMAVLQAVKTEGHPEVAGVGGAGTPLREDVGGKSDPLAVAPHAYAPQMRDGFFLVPRLSTHEAADPGAEDA